MSSDQQPSQAPVDKKHPRDWLEFEVESIDEAIIKAGSSQTGVFEGYLSTTLEQIAAARSAYVSDIKELVTLLVVLFVGAAIVSYYALSTDAVTESVLLFTGAVALVMLVCPVLLAIRQKAWGAYEYYIVTILNAAIGHRAFASALSHQYMAALLDVVDNIPNSITLVQAKWKDAVIYQWMFGEAWSPGSSGKMHTLISAFGMLIVVSWVAFVVGLVIILGIASVHIWVLLARNS